MSEMSQQQNIESTEEDTKEALNQTESDDHTIQLVDAQSCLDLIQNEGKALVELLEVDLTPELNEEIGKLLEQLSLIESGLEARISFLQKSENPKLHFAENSIQFLSDIDLRGATVVFAEFGEKSDLMPHVVDVAHKDTSYGAGLFSFLENEFMARRRAFIGRSNGREAPSFHVSMRGISFQHPETEGDGDLNRRIEDNRQQLGQLHTLLSSIGDHAIEAASPDDAGGFFDASFEGGITKLAIAYVIGPDCEDNRTTIDAARESLEKAGYKVELEHTVLSEELREKYQNFQFDRYSPDLQVHRMVGTSTAIDL